MSDLEDEVKVLKAKNNELVQKVQYWKMTAAQRDDEKLELIKEINELRLKLGRIRNGGAAQVRQLHAALQISSKEAINHLVQASNAITRSMDVANSYIRDRQELDAASPRWSSISSTPTDRVNRVPPLLIGGQSIQPVVSLSRTLLNNTSTRIVNRGPNQQNHNESVRAVPVHMLQDVYIPLTRIDAGEAFRNMETEGESNNIDASTEDLSLEDSTENVLEDSQNLSSIDESDNTRRLNVVIEDLEPEDEEQTPPPVTRMRPENPLEGPSWLLDIQNSQPRKTKCRINLEPDSTTELEDSRRATTSPAVESSLAVPVLNVGFEYSPTVRRRKRNLSPRASVTPKYSPRSKINMSGRVLKVMVAKMKLDDDEGGGGDVSPPKRMNKTITQRSTLSGSPSQRAELSTTPLSEGPRDSPRREPSPKRLMRFDAPSPNGATDARVIVSETKSAACGSGDPASVHDTSGTRDSELVTHDMERDTRETRDTSDTHHDTRDANRDTSDAHRDMSDANRGTCDARDTRDARDAHRDTDRDTSSATRRARASRREIRDSESLESRDSDSSAERTGGEGRTRRPRKVVTYKEKPLNRKMRR